MARSPPELGEFLNPSEVLAAQLSRFFHSLHCWGRMGTGYIWETLSFRGCILQMCCWAWNRFMGCRKLFLQPSFRNRSNRDFFLPFSFFWISIGGYLHIFR